METGGSFADEACRIEANVLFKGKKVEKTHICTEVLSLWIASDKREYIHQMEHRKTLGDAKYIF